MTTLTDIDGVGPAYAESLEDAGFDSVETVAEADPAEIEDTLGNVDGSDIVTSASEQIEGKDDTSDVEEDETDSELTETDSEAIVLDFEISDDQRNHMIRALIDQTIESRRTNNRQQLETTKEAIEELMNGEPYEVSMEQLNRLYTGLNTIESEYRSTRGLSDFVGEVVQARKEVQALREENWDR